MEKVLTPTEFVNDLLQDKFHINPKGLKKEDKLAQDLNIDSLDCVELVMELEKEFDRAIPDAEAESIKTIGDLYSLAEKHCR